MSSWETVVGNFAGLKQKKTVEVMLSSLYKTMLKRRAQFVTDCKNDDPSFVDPHVSSLSLDEENAIANFKGDKKDKPKPSYECEVSKIEKYTENGKQKTKVVGKEKGVKPKGKWITFTGEFKTALAYLLQRFVKEIHDFYTSCGDTMPEEAYVLSEFLTYCSNPPDFIPCISPFIIAITKKVDANQIVEANYDEIDNYLSGKFVEIFKSNGSAPTRQLNVLVYSFVSFLKLIAIQMASTMWYQKRRGEHDFLYSVIRQLSTVVYGEAKFDETSYKQINEYIEERKRLEVLSRDEKKKKTDELKKNKETAASQMSDNIDDEDEFTKALEAGESDLASQLDSQIDDDWGTGTDLNM